MIPPWLRDDTTESSQPFNNSLSGSAGPTYTTGTANQSGMPVNTGTQNSIVRNSKAIHWIMKFVTMSLCLLMAFTAILGISKIFHLLNPVLIKRSDLLICKNNARTCII